MERPTSLETPQCTYLDYYIPEGDTILDVPLCLEWKKVEQTTATINGIPKEYCCMTIISDRNDKEEKYLVGFDAVPFIGIVRDRLVGIHTPDTIEIPVYELDQQLLKKGSHKIRIHLVPDEPSLITEPHFSEKNTFTNRQSIYFDQLWEQYQGKDIPSRIDMVRFGTQNGFTEEEIILPMTHYIKVRFERIYNDVMPSLAEVSSHCNGIGLTEEERTALIAITIQKEISAFTYRVTQGEIPNTSYELEKFIIYLSDKGYKYIAGELSARWLYNVERIQAQLRIVEQSKILAQQLFSAKNGSNNPFFPTTFSKLSNAVQQERKGMQRLVMRGKPTEQEFVSFFTNSPLEKCAYFATSLLFEAMREGVHPEDREWVDNFDFKDNLLFDCMMGTKKIEPNFVQKITELFNKKKMIDPYVCYISSLDKLRELTEWYDLNHSQELEVHLAYLGHDERLRLMMIVSDNGEVFVLYLPRPYFSTIKEDPRALPGMTHGLSSQEIIFLQQVRKFS